MVRIGSLIYDIVADVTKFQAGMVPMRREITAARKIFLETRTPVERLQLEIMGLNRVMRKGGIDADTHARGLKALNKELLAAKFNATPVGKALTHLTGIVGKLGVAFGAVGVSYAGIRFIKNAVLESAKIEDMQVQFEVLSGSISRAATLMNDIRAYDLKTTFTFEQVAAGAQKLLNFGVAANDVMPVLKQLGDVSAGNQMRFERLSLAFGQIHQNTRLQGQEWRQLIEAGFNPMMEIAKKTGESMQQLIQRMRDGGISADEVAEAFKAATSEGGRFFNMMDSRAGKTLGKLQILAGEAQRFMVEFGDLIKGPTEENVEVATDVVKGGRDALGLVKVLFTEAGFREWLSTNVQQPIAEPVARDYARLDPEYSRLEEARKLAMLQYNTLLEPHGPEFGPEMLIGPRPATYEERSEAIAEYNMRLMEEEDARQRANRVMQDQIDFQSMLNDESEAAVERGKEKEKADAEAEAAVKKAQSDKEAAHREEKERKAFEISSPSKGSFDEYRVISDMFNKKDMINERTQEEQLAQLKNLNMMMDTMNFFLRNLNPVRVLF